VCCLLHPVEFSGYSDRSEADKFMGQLMDTTTLAASMVLSTLQSLIRNDWKEIEFRESIAGHPF
jgi:hypothetical protein